ncbi:MAG: LacI family transcriptional regulator [Chitinispirillaceae bacterium]|nr:LacI family transcriptional regulator [Chitinispirillaceae bacterium]
MPVTLKDIAKRAGVTSATVSMVINNKPNISGSTRKKVLAIAKELNYYPNVIARGLATRRSNAIGVIVPNLASSFVVRVLQGIKSTNRDLNYTVLLFDTIGQKENESQLFQRLAREGRVDGVIMISSLVTDEDIRIFAQESVPCIVVARKCDTIDSVYVNNEQGAKDATDYLTGKGHKNIACVISGKTGAVMDDRLSGYKLSLAAHGLSFKQELVFMVDDDLMGDGAGVYEKIMAVKPAVTAVFVPAGDMVAIGILKEAKRHGVSVPGDLAIVGYDDLPAAEVIEPSLTTVRQPKLEMGDYAINMIVDKIEGRESGLKLKELPTKFIIRESA